MKLRLCVGAMNRSGDTVMRGSPSRSTYPQLHHLPRGDEIKKTTGRAPMLRHPLVSSLYRRQNSVVFFCTGAGPDGLTSRCHDFVYRTLSHDGVGHLIQNDHVPSIKRGPHCRQGPRNDSNHPAYERNPASLRVRVNGRGPPGESAPVLSDSRLRFVCSKTEAGSAGFQPPQGPLGGRTRLGTVIETSSNSANV